MPASTAAPAGDFPRLAKIGEAVAIAKHVKMAEAVNTSQTWGLETNPDELGTVSGYVMSTKTEADVMWKEYCKREIRQPRGARNRRDWDLSKPEPEAAPVEPAPAPTRAAPQSPVLLHDRVRGDLASGTHPYATYSGNSYEDRTAARNGPGAYVSNMVVPTSDDRGAVYTKPIHGFSPALAARYNQVHRKYDDIWKETKWSKYDNVSNGPCY
eukprot:TRINITY_DN3042_c0_g1_i1.p1 TRINITY_DN3042_c0_g1~~TRINITY_DN3042_c0_g1_i1.p1  ORF type:complete len:212 (+),score=18.45 TRINITY_DN3042_c0_g1_i1:189-824(+)